MGSSNNEFYDTNTIFTYDKRLYKEFPYIGFYLSLCEERIESELELWPIFRSYLMNDPLLPDVEFNTNNNMNTNINVFIETSWRKAINLVNKTKNVNLNLTPQRLMLFKWCERAIDIPVEDPILILYWQKFFNIYLDKEYLRNKSGSQPNSPSLNSHFGLELKSSQQQQQQNPINSITFKLFTSSTQMNSLMKQIKKQLEMASHYYAYQIKPSDSKSTVASAPVSNYHFTELMSKLYYALSLWIDEIRLHDPTLYLPALPEHYEPNLLARIFNKQLSLWLEYLDINRINYHLNSVLNSIDQLEINKQLAAFLKSSSASSLSSSGGAALLPSSGTDLFFHHQTDRLVLKLPPINELNLKFQYPLVEKYGDVIKKFLEIDMKNRKNINLTSSKAEIQLILSISEHLLSTIFKYNKEFINHSLNYMLKLDDKFTNKLLINLWCNETCEKYVQVPCTSLINPMHQCTRPAMVKFVYELATKRDQVREEIKENRYNHDKITENFFDVTVSVIDSTTNETNYEVKNKFPHDDIIKSMVALNHLIKKLLRNHYMISQQIQNEDVRNFFFKI
jgi:hypothetical protein